MRVLVELSFIAPLKKSPLELTLPTLLSRYEPTEDVWSPVASMATRRIGVGVAVVNRLLYAVGGFDGQKRLNSVECYTPETNSWHFVASMNTTRSGAGMFASRCWCIAYVDLPYYSTFRPIRRLRYRQFDLRRGRVRWI